MKKNLLLFAIFLLPLIGMAQTAATGDYRSLATGNWSSGSTWQIRDGSGNWTTATQAPSSTNNVYIQSGHTVTVDVATADCNNLHLNALGVLSIGSNTLQVSGKLRSFNSYIITKLDWTYSSGTSGTAVVTFTGTKTFTVGNSITVNGLTSTTNTFFNGTHTVTASTSNTVTFSINSTLTSFAANSNGMVAASVQDANNSVTSGVDGTFYSDQVSSTVANQTMVTSTLNSGKIKFIGGSRPITATGEWTAGSAYVKSDFVFALNNATTGTLATNFVGTNITIESGIISSSSRLLANQNTTLTGSVTIKNGATFTSSNTTVIGRTSSDPLNTLTIESGGILELTAAAPLIEAQTIVNNGIVSYNRPNGQTLVTKSHASSTNFTDYYDLKILNSNTKQLPTYSIKISNAVYFDGTASLSNTTNFGTYASKAILKNGSTIYRNSSGANPTSAVFTWGEIAGDVTHVVINATCSNSGELEGAPTPGKVGNLTIASGVTYTVTGGREIVNLINNGTLTLAPATTLTQIISGTISGDGEISLTTAGGAALTFTGSTAVGNLKLNASNNVMRNLTLNNAAGLTLASDATVNNTINLTSGKLTVAAGKTLTLPSATSLINGASSTKYIVTANDGTNIGKVKLTGFATAKTLPVGTTSYYLPVSLTPASSSDFEVSVFQGATTNGALGGTAISADNKLNIVDAVWTVNRTSGSGNCAMQLTWDAALAGATFTNNASDVALGISRYDGALWSSFEKTDGSISSKSVTQTFSSFSPFIIGSASFTLPVTLTNISATVKTAGVELVWETANEDGIRQYVVEKSSNGVDFNAIGFVNASNKGKYIFTDGSASTGVFYYRLKIVSVGGEIAYSKVMMVKTTAAVSVSVYPNPVANSITISGLSGKTSLKIINTAGVTLKQINTAASTLSLDINDLKAGIYMIQAVDASGRVKTVSFIKL